MDGSTSRFEASWLWRQEVITSDGAGHEQRDRQGQESVGQGRTGKRRTRKDRNVKGREGQDMDVDMDMEGRAWTGHCPILS